MNASAAYGMRIEVDSTTQTYYQVGNAEFLGRTPGPNVALSGTGIKSAASSWQYGGGSVNDEWYGSEWRSNPGASENWVGVEWAGGIPKAISALRVVSSTPHGATWAWENWDLEVLVGGTWQWLGQADFTSPQNVFWVNFDSPMKVDAIRLYGSDARGNNGDWIVDELMVYVIPEPGAACLLLAGLSTFAIRRARRQALTSA